MTVNHASHSRASDCTGIQHDHYRSRVTLVPEIVSRIDPVLFGGEQHHGPLTAEQLASFSRDGFIQLHGLFDDEEIEALQALQEHLRSDTSEMDPDTLILEPESAELRSVFQIHAQSELMGRLAGDARLVGIARQILCDDVYVHQSRLNYKPGFFGKEFYWHSDFETWHVEDGMPRMRALSISILLTRNTPYNGPLLIMPGSHHHYVRCVGETPDDHYKRSLRKQEYGVPDADSLLQLYTTGGIATLTGNAGSIVIFDCNAMHGSSSNVSPLPRSNIFLVYNSVQNRLTDPFGRKMPRPEFVASRRNTTALALRSDFLVSAFLHQNSQS